MRLSQLIDRVKTATDNATARKWSPLQIAEVINDQQRSLVRKAAELDEGYGGHRFILLATAARQPRQGDFAWRLPPWIIKISAVRRYEGAGLAEGKIMPQAEKFGDRAGWTYSATNELLFRSMGVAFDLEIECSKLPALLTRGTIQASTSTTLTLDSDASADALIYPHETYRDAYAGALFELTSGPAAGQILRCISNLTVPTGRVLTMEEAFSPAPTALGGDLYEMHAEVADQHINLLVLLATQRLFAQEGNQVGLQLYAAELAREWSSYIQHIEARDVQGPHFKVDPSARYRRDYHCEEI